VTHQGDLDQILAKVAGECHSLSVLRSTRWAYGERIFVPDVSSEVAEFSDS